MSKRYREVLEEVETPASRRAVGSDEAGSGGHDGVAAQLQLAAADELQEHPPGKGGAPPHEPVSGTRGPFPDASGPGGGVATLARPTRTTARAEQADHLPDEHAVPQRTNRPGNGPVDADEPLAFTWRGRRYEVTRILGHWREESGWWRRPDGEPIRIEQSDLWRVEASHAEQIAMTSDGPRHVGRGVYELARRGTAWRLDRVWD